MGIGSPPRSFSRPAWVAAVLLLAAVSVPAWSQAPPMRFQPSWPSASCGGAVMDPYGYPACSNACCGHGGPYVDPAALYGDYAGPFPMGAGGTCPPHGYDLMNDVGIEGYLVDQRGPHYFDIRAEAVYLERDETFGPDIAFTSQQIVGPTTGGQIVLSSGDLEYEGEVGFRVLGRYDIDPLAVFEFGYMGIYEYESSATAVAAPGTRLFSLFSNFGNLVIDGVSVGTANGPMRQTERAVEHSIEIESDLQTAELSYRRYWVGYLPRVSGTLLAGFRYTKLNEGFLFSSIGSPDEPLGGPPATLDYSIDADNNLAGFQAGGDMWIGLIQGLRLGMEGKVGLYNNHYTVETEIESFPGVMATTPATPSPDLEEEFGDDQPALIAEASIDLVADILPSWSVRAGYEVLFINSIVLAGDNFNTGSPYNQGPADNTFGPLRVPFVDDQNDVFFHGGHVGFEYIW